MSSVVRAFVASGNIVLATIALLYAAFCIQGGFQDINHPRTMGPFLVCILLAHVSITTASRAIWVQK